MKKLIFAITLIFIIIAGLFYWKRLISQPSLPNNKVLSATEAPTLSHTPSIWPQSTIVKIDEIPVRISWVQVNPKNVEFYSNLEEKKLSEEIKVNKSCEVLVNGGFYSQDQTHLGLFVNNFETISKPIQSDTLNGFLWIDNNLVISSNSPNFTPRIGMQSGPLLILNNKPLILSINNDSPNRRIVAAATNDNELIFLVFYREQSDIEGPLLGKLPEIINLFEKQTDIDILDAINLDGGSASVFISNYDLLRELSIIGSYFCIK